MSKKLITVLLCAAILCLLFGCSNPANPAADEPELDKEDCGLCTEEEIQKIKDLSVFDVNRNGCHVTSAALIENGDVIPLTKKDYLKILKSEGYATGAPDTDLSKPENTTNMDKAKPHRFRPHVSEPFFAESYIERITCLYSGAASINVKGPVDYGFERTLLCDGGLDVSKSMQKKIDKEIKKQCSLTAYAAALPKSCSIEFPVNTAYAYAAVAYIPRVVNIDAKLHFVESSYLSQFDLSYRYPYTHSEDICDGMYILIQSDKEDLMDTNLG